MKRQTRSERIAAGWRECWGLYNYEDGRWMNEAGDFIDPYKRRKDVGRMPAMRGAVTINEGTDRDMISARPFWRRMALAAPKPFAVGDAVTVRAKVIEIDGDCLTLNTEHDQFLIVRSDVERVNGGGK